MRPPSRSSLYPLLLLTAGVAATLLLPPQILTAQARIVSAPSEPSLLNLTAGWARASTLGDLRDVRTRGEHLELRVWRGYASSETQAIVVRHVEGRWSALLARVIRCEIQVPASAMDTASAATMRQFVVDARRNCGASVVNVTAGSRIIAADTLVVQPLDAAESDIESVWKDAQTAGVLQLPSRVKRGAARDDGLTYVIELRRGDEYRASEIEHVEQPEVRADTQVQQIYAAVLRLRP